MKKLLFSAIFGMMFFASCSSSEEPQPEAGIPSNPIEVEPSNPIEITPDPHNN
ncbi:hypothetical protein KMW28_03210 [Flammeovirga yaeyamensis]|uniref:Uncharacterized protein n=1 Tax=Flammeovirga yaeyamensis TaxID=367791 RepID=A0AAX1N9F3_9BACT|nr:hypothetical protein [Flammeovirga yaeyamensis]MBB3700527.1 PBP1b-binding outer membrane lipoprotein LpoB [Flammeovirga yaeyamensis]NMF36852.1 hypothetical protein [Flammeovirga yaeyamensis]QWG02598.1 hypothetical protein KMW28_03210 [Flammeovirga yaeyamensis]